jgi:DNA-nicking Smr family endonuclease
MARDNPMQRWLRDFPPPSAGEREEEKQSDTKRQTLFPARLDLHGMKREEASLRLRDFLRAGVRGGLRKVLVIHGRGLNSKDGAVLPAVVRAELERNPYVIDFGPAAPAQGGQGATQVFLRQDKCRW